ncbi:hypothetical protein K438DRAFT_1936204 [Mycena galopus ATCC 62051]|nr:hypothetical protein K438DRAFT_1936204 [Mycena galopus ATCC 62051]
MTVAFKSIALRVEDLGAMGGITSGIADSFAKAVYTITPNSDSTKLEVTEGVREDGTAHVQSVQAAQTPSLAYDAAASLIDELHGLLLNLPIGFPEKDPYKINRSIIWQSDEFVWRNSWQPDCRDPSDVEPDHGKFMRAVQIIEELLEKAGVKVEKLV